MGTGSQPAAGASRASTPATSMEPTLWHGAADPASVHPPGYPGSHMMGGSSVSVQQSLSFLRMMCPVDSPVAFGGRAPRPTRSGATSRPANQGTEDGSP